MGDITFADIDPLEIKEDFAVTDYRSANWCAVQAQKAMVEKAKIAAVAKELHQRVNDYQARESKRYEETIIRMQQFLEPWAKKELEGKKNKSFNLPDGNRIGFRSTPEFLDVEDEEKAIAWARINQPDAIKTKETILKIPLKTHLEQKGELAEGCNLIPGSEVFYIKPRE